MFKFVIFKGGDFVEVVGVNLVVVYGDNFIYLYVLVMLFFD